MASSWKVGHLNCVFDNLEKVQKSKILIVQE
jgi:hypothetical protein